MESPHLTTYVLRKDGKLIEYAHTMLCKNNKNPFISLINPVPILNPDTLINKENVTIRVYSDYHIHLGAVVYTVTERSFK